ncbi:hypothetical protein KKE06_05065, partial [Candidatus Micrarchaeota archaeon]|nr:hypothetical protein [Candidatus Micrarchaeota archaeon]
VQKIITTTKYKPIFSDQRPVQKIRIPKPKTVLSKREIIQREILEEIKRRQVIELPSRETEPEIEEPKETPISPPTKKENKIRAQLKKERQLARKVEKIQLQEMEKEVVGMKPKNEKEQRPVSHPIRETKVVKRISVPSDPVHIRKEDIEELKKLIDHKSAGKVDPQQIKQLQSMIEELLQKNMLSRSEVEQNIRAIDANRVLEGFTKLVGLIQPATSSGTIRITPEKFEIPFSPMKKSKKPVGIEKELEKKELITDFDKILEIIRERGSIKLDELAKELKMDKRGVKEVVDILEESNLLIQEYSAFGPSHIVDLEYARTRKKKWGKK